MDLSKETKRERNHIFTTLAGLVRGLEGMTTTVDLRNETSVYGKVIKTDAYMNIEFENALFVDQEGVVQNFDNFYVPSRNIRYVHIPKLLKPEDILKNQWESMSKVRVASSKKPHTFKRSRAEKYQRETIKELSKASTSGVVPVPVSKNQ